MLNFVLCDDNELILSKLSKMLESIFIKNNLSAQVVYSSTNPEQVLDFIQKNEVNVVLLDIDLKSKLTGIEVANIIRKNDKNIYLIFTTGHLEYGLLAYQCKTFDYLSKPITIERLETTINRLFEDISDRPKKFFKLGRGRYNIPALPLTSWHVGSPPGCCWGVHSSSVTDC